MQPAGSIRAVIGNSICAISSVTPDLRKSLFRMPMLPARIVDAHVAAMAPGVVVTSAYLPSRLDMVQKGRVVEFSGEGKEVFPIETVALVD